MYLRPFHQVGSCKEGLSGVLALRSLGAPAGCSCLEPYTPSGLETAMYEQHLGRSGLCRGVDGWVQLGVWCEHRTSSKAPKPLTLKSHIYLPEVPLETSVRMAEFCCGAGAHCAPLPFLPFLWICRSPPWTNLRSGGDEINFDDRVLRAKGLRRCGAGATRDLSREWLAVDAADWTHEISWRCKVWGLVALGGRSSPEWQWSYNNMSYPKSNDEWSRRAESQRRGLAGPPGGGSLHRYQCPCRLRKPPG